MDDDRYTRITLRIPKDLHQSLQESADATSKSLNAEIINRLSASFGDDGGGALAKELKAARALTEKLEAAIAALQSLGTSSEPASKKPRK